MTADSLSGIERREDFFAAVARAPARALLLDYDGTLAPFTSDRQRAFPYPGVREALRAILSAGEGAGARAGEAASRLAVVSGRPVRDLPRLLQVERAPELWGSHGLERLAPDGSYEASPPEPALAALLAEAAAWIEEKGWRDFLERKPYGFALHARGTPPELFARARADVLDRFAEPARRAGLETLEFDGGFELRPAGSHKGDVVRRVERELGPDGVVAYLGDDRTDEDAFSALSERGLGVLVRTEARPTAARLWIRPPRDLLGFLSDWERAIRGGADLASPLRGTDR